MMKPEDKAAWVAALRSGEYKQCQGVLHDGDGFCCLGVAADIFEDSWWVEDGGDWVLVVDDVVRLYVYQPPGLSHAAVRDLSLMNDLGLTFREIAYGIECREDI